MTKTLEPWQKLIVKDKQAMCNALRVFINQRSGIEYGNYQCGDWKQTRECFMGDYRPILKHGRHARQMLRFVEMCDSITGEMILEATRAYSGRLQFITKVQNGETWTACSYTTGQYFPTEYRNAACAVLAQCIWDYWRSNDEKRMGDDIRKLARFEFGRAIASTWFH